MTGDVLGQAAELLSVEREKEYGDARENHERIAALWSVLFGVTVTARQVALAMVLVKVSREVSGPKADNLVDGAAYFAIAGLVS